MTYESARDLDRIDCQILEALHANGRLSVAELAEKVSLSASPCWRRVQMLEQAGFILGYSAQLDRRKLGFGVHAFISVRMERHSTAVESSFEASVVAMPEVIACQNLSGQYDYQIELISEDHESFSHLVREAIRCLPGVKDIHTSFVFKELKPRRVFPPLSPSILGTSKSR
jgi:DNA-binding Lrp family transcriptional regulator